MANPEPTCQEPTTLRGEVIRGMDKAETVTQHTVGAANVFYGSLNNSRHLTVAYDDDKDFLCKKRTKPKNRNITFIVVISYQCV